MMLTPAAPRAGPIGGAGLAFPAGIASLIIRSTFVAICGCETRFVYPADATAAATETSPKADQQSKAKAEPAPLGSGAAAAGATATPTASATVGAETSGGDCIA